tara:strand:+ start:11121 stop:12068 length:948 start_codon:yes stop_codon:yes gene_type:complete
MTFSSGTGENYRPGGQSHSDFTFESSHRAPQFPPSGPANPGSRAPTQRERRGRADKYGSSRNGRNNANGQRRGGYRKPAPHERALLQHRDDGSPEHTYGVSAGPNRFLNPDDLSDNEEADMDVESSPSGDDTAQVQNGNQKVARTQVARADGNSVPKWSNPDPYTALPPPSETTGVKKDVVQFIRKAKNQDAEKSAGNIDFISLGDDDDDASTGLHIYEDDEPVQLRRKANGPTRPVVGSMNEMAYSVSTRDEPRYDPNPRRNPSKPERSSGHKRKIGGDVAIKPEWMASSRCDPTPWTKDPRANAHLADQPERW